MNQQHASLPLHKGQFLWMEPTERSDYLQRLKERISEGYYNTEQVFSRIADELAPVLEEMVSSH